MSELNLILIGPPGAGKGTQAERLVADFGLPYYATGDILRAAVAEESDLGRKAKEHMDNGGLVPDELICDVIMDRIDSSEAHEGFLLDGFPRTVRQAEVLDEGMKSRGRKLTAALLITAPDEEVIRRLSGRRICVKNQHLYHLEFDPPKREGVCDQDGSRLIQRKDDEVETIKRRLATYHEETEPAVEWYAKVGLLRRFEGTRPADEVHGRIRATLAAMRLESEL